MSLITVANVSKYFGAERILDGVSMRLDRGEHIALVGANGAGKSTLLRILAHVEEPDAGSATWARDCLVSYLPQEAEFTETDTLFESMMRVFRPMIEAQERIQSLEERLSAGHDDPGLLEEYGRLQSIVEHTGYDYTARIERVLTGLGLSRETWHEPIAVLSGGQRTRANVGRTLLLDADVLLLDEPTNHLDIPAVEWLESYLKELKAAFVVVAHDRYLLERVTHRTLELSHGKVASYDAPYDRYLEQRAERALRQQREYDAQQEQIAQTEEFIRRYGAGQRYKDARGRQKRLDRMERLQKPPEESTVHLASKGVTRSGEIVLEVRDLAAGYGGKPLVRLTDDVTVRRGDRVALIGPNGSGKTTLLRTLVEALPPVAGTVRWGAKTSIGYYSQTLEQLDDRRIVLEEIQRTQPLGDEDARKYLGQFLFSGEDVFKSIGVLSGGERSRVALAKLMLEDSNVLVLDEPTNHLDIASRDALRTVLARFAGTLLFASHDRYLIDHLAQHLWVVDRGALERYAGTYSEYAGGTARSLDAPRKTAPHGSERTPRSPEERLTALEGEALQVAGRLADGGATLSLAHLTELTERYERLLADLSQVEDEWLRGIRKQLHASSV